MRRAGSFIPARSIPSPTATSTVVGRALQLFDEVVLAIAADSTKTPLFTLEERRAMAEQAFASFGKQVRVVAFHGLLIDFVRKENSRAILRGLRAISDFEYEFQMALMNRKLNDSIETLFLMPRGAYTYLRLHHHQGNRAARRRPLRPLCPAVWRGPCARSIM